MLLLMGQPTGCSASKVQSMRSLHKEANDLYHGCLQERTALGTLERAQELVALHKTAVAAIKRRVDAAAAAECQVRHRRQDRRLVSCPRTNVKA